MSTAKKPFLPRVEHFTDCTGAKRAFEICQGLKTDGVVVSAYEVEPPCAPGYKFSAWSATQGDALGKLRLKIREGLARRYLSGIPEHGLGMLTHNLSGLVGSGGLIIDGRHIPFNEIVAEFSSFEGWGIEIKITDSSV